MLLAVLVLGVAPLALSSASHANTNVVPISAIIVLLMPAVSDPLHSAIDRVLEVAVGAVVSLLLSFFLVPSRAHRPTRAVGARTLEGGAVSPTPLVRGGLGGVAVDAQHRRPGKLGALLI